jgi:hypothetical protein
MNSLHEPTDKKDNLINIGNCAKNKFAKNLVISLPYRFQHFESSHPCNDLENLVASKQNHKIHFLYSVFPNNIT